MREPSTNTSYAGAIRGRAVVVLLAGGAGSRFAGPEHKLVAMLPKTATRPRSTVFARALSAAWEAGVGPMVVVHGALDEAALRVDELAAETLRRAASSAPDRSITFIHNADWASGQATSLHTGLRWGQQHGATAAIVGLADQPGVSIEAWREVAAGPGPIVVATYGGRRGNPVRLDAQVWESLPSTGDEGARTLMQQRPDLVTGVPCTGSPNDIDTAEDLQTWQSN